MTPYIVENRIDVTQDLVIAQSDYPFPETRSAVARSAVGYEEKRRFSILVLKATYLGVELLPGGIVFSLRIELIDGGKYQLSQWGEGIGGIYQAEVVTAHEHRMPVDDLQKEGFLMPVENYIKIKIMILLTPSSSLMPIFLSMIYVPATVPAERSVL